MLLTGTAYPTLVHVLQRRAALHPSRVAFHYASLSGSSGGSGSSESELTYGELDRKARVVAAQLKAAGCGYEPVMLLFEPGLSFITAFFGCLYAGTIAVPAYPPAGTRGQALSRLRAILGDCGARVVLTHEPVAASLPTFQREAPELGALCWTKTEELTENDADSFAEEAPDPDRAAFLQYTSGSTASPRGAVVTHANVIANLECIREAFAGDPETDHGVFWLPQYHDMGLTGGLLLTCWGGSRSTILSPLAFVKRPLLWLRTITRTGATISGGPNFAYDLCLQRVSDSDLETLDLSTWRIAFSGAETVQARTCIEFARRFERCGFRPDAFQPGYGLAEATLIVTSRPPASPLSRVELDAHALSDGRAQLRVSPEREGQTRTLVSCGAPVRGQEMRIVDPESRRELLPLEIGEVWVRGASIAQGYWKRPEESEATFGGRLDTGEGPYLRTGDLGFLHEGELFVTGRRKELLIFNGKNHYPLDIERTVLDTDADVSLCAAVSAAGLSGECLVVICQPRARRDFETRAMAIRQAVARDHGIAVHDVAFVPPGEISRTSSGKIQRLAAAARYESGELVRLDSEDRSERLASCVALLTSEIAGKANIPEGDVDIHAPFVAYGLGSVDAVRISGRLEEHLGRSLSPTLAYEYPTIDALARYLVTGEERSRSDAARQERTGAEDGIAIVGMACRFPGASDLKAFESLLRGGRDAVGPMPEGRATDAGARPVAGYLDSVDRFASDLFSIDAAEAAAMDPQQRLLLELAFEAFEDSGHPSATRRGSATGVWVGISSADYALERFGDRNAHPHTHAAQAHSIAANRISYQFDLQGPSIAVDTACSSSLVALHLAVQSMRAGECSLALVGGVNVLLSRVITEQFQAGGYMSASGRCRAFDAGADGYVRGEGAAVVVLKPLSRAIADRDRVYAVVRATAVNQDGRTNGLTAPSRQAQEALLRRAYAAAGVDPGAVATIEAHGTGTPLGDPIEARALGAVLGRDRSPSNPCRIGSVKTNIGHLEASAGIAGLVKTALSLYTRTLYPSCHFEKPNPNIDLESLGLRVQTECETWPQGVEALAGVSSFGFGGTNAHAVLSSAAIQAPTEESDLPILLPVSAPSASGLSAHARALADTLDSAKPHSTDIHFTAARRSHHNYRAAVFGRTAGELAERLRSVTGAARGAAKAERIAFAFGGQGGQWLGMGRDLLSGEPVFRAALERVAAAVEREAGWSFDESLRDPRSYERLDRVQPMLFGIGVALSQLLRSWGIEPVLMIGQSMGEITAATAAGALTLDDGARAIVRRSALLARLSGSGSMAMVDLPGELAAERVQKHGVTVAVYASPTTSVIAGEEDAVCAASAELERDGVGVRPVKVDVASHCFLVEPLREPLLRELGSIRGRKGTVPLLSSVTGHSLTGDEIDSAYLWKNLREPVRFSETIERAVALGARSFVEIGPHPVLTASIAQCLGGNGLVLPTMHRDRDGREALLETAAQLYEGGRDLTWPAMSPGGRIIDLPQPPLPRRRHWTEPPSRRSFARELSHPLLESEMESAALSPARVFELSLSAAAFPVLAQHRIGGAPIVSAGAFLELAHAAIRETLPERDIVLSNVRFERFLQLPASGSRSVQVVVTPDEFVIHSRSAERVWTRHASGAYRIAAGGETIATIAIAPLSEGARAIPVRELYAAFEERGLTYGSLCQRLAEARADGATCEVRLDAHEDLNDPRYVLHPLLADMCLQALAPLVERPALLQGVRELRRLRRPEGPVTARAAKDGDSFQIVVTDANGVVATASGLELTTSETRPLREPDVWRKRIAWSRVDPPAPASFSGRLRIVGPSGALKEALESRAGSSSENVGENDAGIVFVAARDTALADFVRLAQNARVPVTLVTRGAFGVLADDARDAMHAALAAAARAAWAEGAFEGASIDLDPDLTASPEAEAEQIWREIAARGRHSIVAFRGEGRYAPRFERARESRSRLLIEAHSSYLVTGGLSDLGLHAAKWLVRKGAKRLILCGRSAPSDLSKKLARIEGASVQYRSVDVSDANAVARLAKEVGPVAGIVHAAGFSELCPFSELDEGKIASAFRPKVEGAENLKRHFVGPELKFFVLYASSSAWLGALGRGLAPYAAANAYLEAFASELTRSGTNGFAVAWPPWHGIGRVREAAAAGHFESLGVATIGPEEADEVLNHLVGPATLLCAIDRDRYVCRGADDLLLRDLDDGASSAPPPAVAAPYEAPRDLLEERLASSWREVLGVERVGRNDSFFALGGSSIKAATLLNRLRRHMSEPISIVALFEAPTVANLAAYLRERHPDCAAAIEEESALEPLELMPIESKRPQDLLARIDELSDEEVEALLVEHGNVDAR